ncbi:MAG: hypothetical protein SVZ03_04480 [Spirochaetota bacterium]|nr:hypothetical protein [Spirochaetota bacterium]
MERVIVWYLTDHNEGENVANLIKELGLTTNIVKKKNFKNEKIADDDINIFVIDVKNSELLQILYLFKEDKRLSKFIKYAILSKRQIKEAIDASFDILHLEFISRPIVTREFILLIEKTVIVESYKEIMKYISQEIGFRIEAFESMMDINRKDVFASEKEKETFKKILQYEKRLMLEQSKLNKAIEKFTLSRQREIFDMRSRIEAEEMLENLRREELLDANSIIKAQEAVINFSSEKLLEASNGIKAGDQLDELRRKERIDADNTIKAQEAVIDFSSKKLLEATKVIDANEKLSELSRMETMQLHEELLKSKNANKSLFEENLRLKNELKKIKKRKD